MFKYECYAKSIRPLYENDHRDCLRCSILACRSYVALYHNDHAVALRSADQLLRQPRLTGAHRYLAHMYMGEALVALDRIADGIDHLNPDLVSDVSTILPPEQKPQESGNTVTSAILGGPKFLRSGTILF